MTSTYFGLLAEFDGRAQLPLEEVAPRYFGINVKTAGARALAQSLPVPAYRAVKSQKAPWFVNAMDLALYLDQRREEAFQEWQAAQQDASPA